MNNITNLYKAFQDHNISKHEYIDQAYLIHDVLFQYAEWLPETDIKNISISDKEVKMTLRESNLTFKCLKNDKRLATLDILNFKTYEKDEIEMQLALMSDQGNIFDIGANYGWYALQVGYYKPNAKIYSFEPIPNTFQAFISNIIENKASNIYPYNNGFSDSEQILDFYIDESLSVNASMQNVSDSSNAKKVTCITKTLDQFVENEHLKIDFIKCDVEGAELLVFKGGKKVFKNQRPIIFTEMLRKWSAKFNYHPNDIIQFFKELGYSCYYIGDNQTLKPIIEVTEDTIQTNFFFLHKEEHKSKIQKFVKL